MKNFITVAKNIMLTDLPHDGVFVDYTMTDGYGSLYMAKYVSEGNIVSFASDESKMDGAYRLFESNFQDNVHIKLDSPLNVAKYVTTNINGFMLDAVKVKMDDDTIIGTIKTSLKMMNRSGRAMVTLGDDNAKTKSFVETLPYDEVSVMKIALGNVAGPTIYILEKLK